MIVKSNWASFKSVKDNYLYVIYYVTDGANYIVYSGDRFTTYLCVIKPGADKTDFDNNYKAAATSVSNESEAIAGTRSGIFLVFSSESLADGVYENSKIISCDYASKTFNLENATPLVTGVDLYYKIYGSPNNSDWEEIKSETIILRGTKTSVTNNDMWKYVKIAAKGSAGVSTITAYIQVGT
jgi:hypothetical protein